MTFTFEQALDTVRQKLSHAEIRPSIETVPLHQSLGRVLAEDLRADRDYPPFPRSARDGFAVRSADVTAVPVTLRVTAEVRAGEFYGGKVGTGECVSIMTGAPVPEGADAVVMVEHTRAAGSSVTLLRPAQALDNVVARGREAEAGRVVLRRGHRLGAGCLGLLASIGAAQVRVYRRPEVALLATGDELVSLETRPEWFEIRNSNSYSLAAQVASSGGFARPLAIAPDAEEPLKRLILEGLESDLLLLSGGVSAGKYDLVEKILQEVGAEFYFNSVAIRPGKPVVFGRARDKFFFGLPGNPISTYATFEIFVRPAIGVLSGAEFEPPLFLAARVSKSVKRREGLTAFVPALAKRLNGIPVVDPARWQGSGDLAGFADANCFLVIYPDREPPQAGDWADVMPLKR